MTEWNPDDPDATRVHYDLGAWTFDEQAELAAALADAEVPHGWFGGELLVPPEFEEQVDAITGALEDRLGIRYDDDGRRIGGTPAAATLSAEVTEGITEFELDEWSATDRTTASRALAEAGVPFRWDGTTLVVPTDDEAVVDELLDDIESGEFVDFGDGAVDEPTDEDDELSAEVLTTFFLAGEKLRRNPLDADGLGQLVAANEIADPDRPPFGVAPQLWRATCLLADRLVDALVDDGGPDREAAEAAAGELYELLRPVV